MFLRICSCRYQCTLALTEYWSVPSLAVAEWELRTFKKACDGIMAAIEAIKKADKPDDADNVHYDVLRLLDGESFAAKAGVVHTALATLPQNYKGGVGKISAVIEERRATTSDYTTTDNCRSRLLWSDGRDTLPLALVPVVLS